MYKVVRWVSVSTSEKQIDYSPISIFKTFHCFSRSVVAVSGNDFAIIAADTRLSAGFSIYTRQQRKLFKLSENTVLGCSGCWCDTLTLTRVISARMQVPYILNPCSLLNFANYNKFQLTFQMYMHDHHKVMSTPAAAQMLAIMLYHKRFFPYYVSNILAGLDENGQGIIYRYDPVGHCEISKCVAGGSAGALLQPLLDNQVIHVNNSITQ